MKGSPKKTGSILTPPSKEQCLNMYRQMLTIREFEKTLFYLFAQGGMPGTMHQCTGQEAVAVGICNALAENDVICSTHRGHGHCLAKGMSIKAAMAEMFGRESGCCRGRGGSMHLADIKHGIFGANGIVGGGIPLAVGVALSFQISKSRHIAVSFFGDGAINTGAFHESVNLAAIWNLPVFFVCENNLYAVSSPINRFTRLKHLSERAQAYGIMGETVDGNNVLEVYNAAKRHVAQIRAGAGPSLIEAVTYRLRGHARFDPAKYRPEEEIEEWKKRDPIQCFAHYLIEENLADDSLLASIAKEVASTIQDAVDYARNSKESTLGTMEREVYA